MSIPGFVLNLLVVLAVWTAASVLFGVIWAVLRMWIDETLSKAASGTADTREDR